MKWGWRVCAEPGKRAWIFDATWKVEFDESTRLWYPVIGGKWTLEGFREVGQAIEAAERRMDQ